MMSVIHKGQLFPPDQEGRSLQDAIDLVESRAHDGTDCPCCQQHIKVYQRSLNSTMGVCLVALFKLWSIDRDWVHISEITNLVHLMTYHAFSHPTGELGKLVHWGLVKKHPGFDPRRKRTGGLWAPTELGRSFAACNAGVNKTILLCRNEAFESPIYELVNIRQVIGDKWDYDELMALEIRRANHDG